MAKVIAKSDTHAGLREKLQAAVTAKHGDPKADYYNGDAYVHDVTDKKVIHSKAGKENRGKLFSSPYKQKEDGTVTLGEPQEVEPAYKPLSEAEMGVVLEAAAFTEGAKAYNTKTREIVVTIIKPGFNKSKSRYYSPAALRETGDVFTNAKMFANHATKAEEASRPEGRVQDWVANLGTPYLEADGSLRARAKVHDAEFGKKLDALQEAGQLTEMGVSIRAFGVQTPATVQGTKTLLVEAFKHCKSVDFVTFPGAGGRVEMMESDTQHFLSASELEAVFCEADADDIDLMPLTELRTRRPDLVALITKEVRESVNMEKTTEQLIQERDTEKTRADAAEAKLQEADKNVKKLAVTTELDAQLKESGLPEVSQKRIRAQFAEATETKDIKAAVDAEKAYLKEAGVVTKPGVKHMGEVRESSDPDKKTRRENYIVTMSKTPGWTKEMAESSADEMGL